MHIIQRFTFFIVLTLLFACNSADKKTEHNQVGKEAIFKTAGTKTAEITFKNVNLTAMLLGSKITLLNDDLSFKKDISSASQKLVSVTKVSEKYFKEKQSDEFCDQFLYVRVKGEDFEGLVDGRKVFQIMGNRKKIFLKNDSADIEFKPTNWFGMGVVYDGGLSQCNFYSPVYVIDRKSGYQGTINMVKKPSVNVNSSYPYLQLMADDGGLDSVENVEMKDKSYFMHIHRTLQEGEGEILIEIWRNENGNYYANVLEENFRDF